MENSYYIIVNGQQIGPMGAEELVYRGLSPDSIVWRQGLADWTQARNLPELQPLLYSSVNNEAPTQNTQPSYPHQPAEYQHEYDSPKYPNGQAPTGQPYSGYGQPLQNQPPYGSPVQPIRHSNWMTPAIIATVLGCLFSCIGLIFGIIAITQASSANVAYARGDAYEGDRLNSNAKTWTIITFVLSGLGLLASVIWFFVTLVASIGSI